MTPITERMIRDKLAYHLGQALPGVTCFAYVPVVTSAGDIETLSLKDGAGTLHYAFIVRRQRTTDKVAVNVGGTVRRTQDYRVQICHALQLSGAGYHQVAADAEAVLDYLLAYTPKELFPAADGFEAGVQYPAEFEFTDEQGHIEIPNVGVVDFATINLSFAVARRRA